MHQASTRTRVVAITFATLVSGCGEGTSLNATAQNIERERASDPRSGGRLSPLILAINAGDVALVKTILQAGADPDEAGVARSPLISAIHSLQGGKFVCADQIVRLLLDHGADPNRRDPNIGTLPLNDALEISDVNCAKMLKNAGATWADREGGPSELILSATKGAVLSGSSLILDEVLGWGVDINAQDPRSGYYSVFEGVWSNNLDVLKMLRARGANMCLRNSDGQSPLDFALNLKRSDAIVVFLRAADCK